MKVKICGIRSLTDAHAGVGCRSGHAGLQFLSRSPRYISPGDCMRLVVRLETALREEMSRVTMVGVFVNCRAR